MKNILYLIFYFELLISTFSIIPLWNFESSTIDLLSESNIYNYTLLTTYANCLFTFKKSIIKEGNSITERNYIVIDNNIEIPTEWEDIDTVFSIDDFIIICPKGSNHMNKYENGEFIPYIPDDFTETEWELKCYNQIRLDIISVAYLSKTNKFYSYNFDINAWMNMIEFNTILYDFRWTISEIQLNVYPMIHLSEDNGKISLIASDVTISSENNTIIKSEKTKKDLITSLTYKNAFFGLENYQFFFITYEKDPPTFISGYSLTKNLDESDIDSLNVTINYESPFDFYYDYTITNVELIRNSRYAFYQIYNVVKEKTYYGIIDIVLNKVIFNTCEEIKSFKPFIEHQQCYSMLAITKESAYRICAYVNNGYCEDTSYCPDANYFIDSQGINFNGNKCPEYILVPNNICINECDENIFFSNDSYHCGFCIHIDENNPYKLLNNTGCLNEIREGAYLYNEKYKLLKSNSNKILTTIPTAIPTTIAITIPTTILTSIPTTIPTAIPTTISITSIPTTIPTTIAITIPTTIAISIPTTIPTTIYNTIFSTIESTVITTTISSTIPNSNFESESTILNFNPTTMPSTYILNITCLYGYFFVGEDKYCYSEDGKADSKDINALYISLQKSMKVQNSQIIQEEKAFLQLSTIAEQLNNETSYLSSIDLRECESLLREKEGLSEDQQFLIIKIDFKSEDLSSTYVQYEIYHPKDLHKISLEICKNITINIKIPFNLNNDTKSLCLYMQDSDFDIFNINDSFYNDICSTYTAQNGADMTLSDRKTYIYDNINSVSFSCQEDCEFISYDCETQKVNCDCHVQISETINDISKISFDKKELLDSFYSVLKNSNFLVLKCFKLVFSLIGQKNNYGSYMMTGFMVLFIVPTIIYIVKGQKNIQDIINTILLKKKINNNNNKIDKINTIDAKLENRNKRRKSIKKKHIKKKKHQRKKLIKMKKKLKALKTT